METMNDDIINAYILQFLGFDVQHMTLSMDMPEWEYNAISFAHANDLSTLIGTPECQWVFNFLYQ